MNYGGWKLQDLLIIFGGVPFNRGGKGFGKVRDMCPIARSDLKNGLCSRKVGEVLSKHLTDRFTIDLGEVLQGRDSTVCLEWLSGQYY